MKESDWRYLVDVLLFVCLGGMTLIGFLLGLVIPAGPVSSEAAKYFLGLHRHQWGNIHAYLSIAFVVLIVIHLILNWKWVTTKTAQIFKRRAVPILILTSLIPFLVLFVFWLFTPRDAAKYRQYGIESPQRGRLHRAVPEDKAPAGKASLAGGDVVQPEISPNHESRAGLEPEARDGSEPRTLFHREEGHQGGGSLVQTGRQTLDDIERATGISARAIADRLGLPSSVPLDETLGRLRRRYGIEIQAVRELVERMLKE